MTLTTKHHALVLILGISALLSTPGTGGAVYWTTLTITTFGSLYFLTYAGTKLYCAGRNRLGHVTGH